ncbi:MAG: hypothetical protein ACOX9A_08260 [Anaerolineae bacterium]
MDSIPSLLHQVDTERMKNDLAFLAGELPCRTLNITRPGRKQCTLYEADAYIITRFASCGYDVRREAVPVQAFRRNVLAPLPYQCATPDPADPWYEAYNLYATLTGRERPDDIIVVLAHKDSQSWFYPSPGAYDNARAPWPPSRSPASWPIMRHIARSGFSSVMKNTRHGPAWPRRNRWWHLICR